MNNYKDLLDRHHKYLRYLLVLSFITFVILIAATSVQGACLSIDAVSTGTTASDTSTSLTVSHTTGSDSDRLMLVAISVNVNDDERVDDPNGVTYGGTPLTKVGEHANDNDAMVYIYSLVAPNPGTADVVINFTSALNYGALAGVMTFTGVHQSTPLGTFASAIGSDSSPASVDISSAPGELVFAVVTDEYEAITTAPTGQDVHWNTLSNDNNYGAGGTIAGASPTVTMTWNLASSSSNHWAIGGVSIKPSSSKSVVMVTIDGTTNGDADDTSKRALFESWGWTVNAIDDGAGQATYDNAAANNDVMFISESALSNDVGTKATLLDIGIVVEENLCWDEMRFTSGSQDLEHTTINISDNSHYITSVFSTGNKVIYSSQDSIGNMSGSLASGGQSLATENNTSSATLFTFDTGANLTSGTAPNRRVGIPTSESTFSNWTADAKTIVQRSLDWASGCGVEGGGSGCGTNLVMVTATGDFSSSYDSAKKTLFESWGWTVSAIEDLNGDYSGAASSNDVMFISESVTSGAVGTQARDLDIGIFLEESLLSDEMEFVVGSASDDRTAGTQIDIVDNLHYITSTLSTGSLQIYNSSDQIVVNLQALPTGAMVLAEEIGSSNTALTAFATGAVLDGGITAANRRVHLIAMHESNPSNWTSDMETLVQRSLDWAAGCGADGGGSTNNDPVLNSVGNKSVDEGQLLEFTISATDPDGGDTLTYSASNLPTGATFTPATQTFSWTPNVGDAGSYPNVLFTVQDDGTPQGSDSEGITITVNSSGGGGLGTPITAGDVAGYSCNMKITIDNTKVAFASPENFPVLISLTDESLKTSGCGFVTDPDGDDIVFTNSNLTLQLYHEIEKYDETTGEIVAWVLVPALSGTTDTDIYMYFGNSSVTSPTESPADVWDSDYAGVWHLKEDAATGASDTWEDRIATHEDDSEETISSGSIDWGSSDLELGEEGSAQIVGMRWRNITIPQGATITSAYIEFTADEVQTGTPVNLTFWGEDVDNAAVFQDAAYNISSTHYNNKTSASVAWNNVPTWPAVGATHQSPDISPIIQEIVNRGGWTSGNALVVLVTGSGRRTADSYSEPTKAPLLHVEYSTATDLHLDSTSNDNDGIPNGNTLTTSGKIDGAQDFDGTNDWIKVPHSSSLNLTGDVTMEFWMKYDTWQTWDFMVGKGDDSNSDVSYGVQFWDVSNRYGSDYTDNSSNWCGGSANSTLSSGSWYHISVTYNASTNTLNFYRNGQADGSDSGCNADTSTVALGIGADGLGQRSFDGVLDEVRISNTLRSAAWIETSYNNQNSPSSFYSVEKNCPTTIPPIAEFTCSIPLTIDSSKVSGTADLIDFPVLISLTNTGLKATSNCGYVENSNGYDIIFSNETQATVLDHEIEKYDGASGELVAWVKMPTLSATSDTTIYVHFGHSSVCGATENPTGVWDSSYVGVWHLDDMNNLKDSTSYNNDGTSSNVDDATGKIGIGQNFDGSDDYISVPNEESLNVTSELTMEAWVNLTNAGNNQKIVGKVNSTYTRGYLIGVQSGLYPEIWNSQGTNHVFTSGSISSSQWTHLATTWTTGGNMIGYINGSQVNSISAGSYNIGTNTDDLVIGAAPWNPTTFEVNGDIDEVRISKVARTADWIETSYNNQNDPSSFYSVGTSSCFLGGFSCNRKISIDSTKVGGSTDLTDFPLFIRIQNDCNLKTAANGGTVQNSNGWDIVFTDSDGVTQLDHEIEEYDGTTGDLTAWVRIPTLPYNSDKDVYMYYGKSGLACDPSNPTGVWSNNFRGVWHLSDTSGATQDSTSYDTDGTLSGTISRGYSSPIYNAFNFGTNGEVDWGDPGDGHLDFGSGEMTLSLWVNMDNHRGAWEQIIFKGKNSWQSGYQIEVNDTSNTFYFAISDGSISEWGRSATISFSLDTWTHVVGVVDRSSNLLRTYKDGVQVDTTGISGMGSINVADELTIGRNDWGWPDARIEEVRLANTARSAGWITTEYNNQSDPDSFFTMSQDTCGGTYGFNFQYCKKIVVDHTQVSGDLTRYPLLINITGDDDLKTVANGGRVQHSQGWDIVFRTEGCGNYDHEIEKYDGANGDLVAWVQIPTLSSSTDTEIYMYYGANVICDTSNPTAVWDDRFRGVYHLNDDFEDSTQYNHDGTNNGATFTASKIGNGALFTPSNGWDYIDLGTWSMGTDDVTLQAWVWPNDFNQGDPRIVSKCADWGSGAQDHVYMLSLYNGDNGENRMRFRVKTGTDNASGTVELFGTSPNGYLPSAQSWYFLAATYEDDNDAGTEMRMYRDEGLDAGQVGHAGDLRENSWPVWIGASPYGTSNSEYSWDGILDEVRILSSDLSQDWLETEYRNHNDPGNFYSITSCFEQTTEVTQEWVEEVQ